MYYLLGLMNIVFMLFFLSDLLFYLGNKDSEFELF